MGSGRACIQWNEPSDNYGWKDRNYLCGTTLTSNFEWKSGYSPHSTQQGPTAQFSQEYGGLPLINMVPINGMQCYGPYCDNKELWYRTFSSGYDMFLSGSSNTYWTSEFSNEGNGFGTCASNHPGYGNLYLVSRMQCLRDRCDRLKLQCTKIDTSLYRITPSVHETPYFSNEQNYRTDCPAGYFVRGIHCRGYLCDSLSLTCVKVEYTLDLSLSCSSSNYGNSQPCNERSVSVFPSTYNSCSSSVKEEDCLEAGLSAGGKLWNGEVRSTSSSSRPFGCHLYPGLSGDDIWYNSDPSGQNDGKGYPVCHIPSAIPSVTPSSTPSVMSSTEPSSAPNIVPTVFLSTKPSSVSSVHPSTIPSTSPVTWTQMPSQTTYPSIPPSAIPSPQPTVYPTPEPTVYSTMPPSAMPSISFSSAPSETTTPVPSSPPPSETSVSPAPTPLCEVSFSLDILTDNYGSETYWDVTNDADGSVVLSAAPGSYSSNTFYEIDECLDIGCYTFTMFDTLGDGMRCGINGPGYYNVTVNGNDVGSGGGNFGLMDTPIPFCGNPCFDSPAKRIDSQGTIGGCDVVAADPSSYCPINEAQSFCPVTCNACPMYECEDFPAPFFLMINTQYTCAQIEGLDQATIAFFCSFPEVYNTCRATCGNCVQ